MSVGDFSREVFWAFVKILKGTIGWALIAPIAFLIPKRKSWVAIIGRDDGKFVDNAKYFLLQGTPLFALGTRIAFVTERRDTLAFLKNMEHAVVRYPTWRGVWFLLRASTLIVDSSEWVWGFRRFLLTGSKKVQLWHGVGYKRIELDKLWHEARGSVLAAPWMAFVRRLMMVVTGRLVRFDVIVATSMFYAEKVFKPAFLSRHCLVTGYPRNTFGQVDGIQSLAWENVDSTVASCAQTWMQDGRRIVLITPTFRDARVSMCLDEDTLSALDDFCESNKLELLFKFHPLEQGVNRVRGKHLHLCDPSSDLYPIMPLSSAMITDYSSIYMDYLLLDKPVLFLVPDLEDYTSKDRQFQFDFNEMTPGPKLSTWTEVMTALEEQWHQDDYAEQRAWLRRLAFDDLPQEQAVPKIIAFMREQGWV